jgi:cellulose biosynthesis protein BcsQ
VNIAWHAASEGIPTLLWDLDPQGAASWLLNSKAKSKTAPKKILNGKTPIGELVKSTDYPNLDIIPSDFSLRHLDQQLAQQND